MALDNSEIRVGASGRIYVAPTGSTLPTDAGTALDAAFADLGYLSEDGVALTIEMTVERLRAWQSNKPVRVVKTEDNLTAGFTLMQANEVTVPLALGGGTVTDNGGGEYKIVPPAAGTVDERAFVIEWVDNAINNRLVIPRGIVSDVGEIAVTKGSAVALELSAEVLGTAPDDYEWYTDDPAFAA